MIQGQPADMKIHCVAPRRCEHRKVSWFTNYGDCIPFDTFDPHFRRKSEDNWHKLEIDKACLEDRGTFKVKKETYEKECKLYVIGKQYVMENQ